MSETQTIISGLVVSGSTYLGDVHNDPGGASIALHTVRAANRYLDSGNHETETSKSRTVRGTGRRVVDIASITYRTVSDTLHARPF